MLHLNGLLSKRKFWIEFVQSTGYSRYASIEPILSLCRTISFVIIGSFVLYTLPSIISDDYGRYFTISHMQLSFAVHRFELATCVVLLCIVYWKIRQSRETFYRNEIACFSVGYDALPRDRSTDRSNDLFCCHSEYVSFSFFLSYCSKRWTHFGVVQLRYQRNRQIKVYPLGIQMQM